MYITVQIEDGHIVEAMSCSADGNTHAVEHTENDLVWDHKWSVHVSPEGIECVTLRAKRPRPIITYTVRYNGVAQLALTKGTEHKILCTERVFLEPGHFTGILKLRYEREPYLRRSAFFSSSEVKEVLERKGIREVRWQSMKDFALHVHAHGAAPVVRTTTDGMQVFYRGRDYALTDGRIELSRAGSRYVVKLKDATWAMFTSVNANGKTYRLLYTKLRIEGLAALPDLQTPLVLTDEVLEFPDARRKAPEAPDALPTDEVQEVPDALPASEMPLAPTDEQAA